MLNESQNTRSIQKVVRLTGAVGGSLGRTGKSHYVKDWRSTSICALSLSRVDSSRRLIEFSKLKANLCW